VRLAADWGDAECQYAHTKVQHLALAHGQKNKLFGPDGEASKVKIVTKEKLYGTKEEKLQGSKERL